MKPDRIAHVVLVALALLFAVLYFTKKEKPLAPQAPREIHHTNTVDRWHTNTVETWRTNTVELWRTNTVVQRVTNEVIKEVPAKIPEAARSAAALGHQHGHAPSLSNRGDLLYKAAPLAAEITMNDSARALLPSPQADALKRRVEDALRTRGISVADNSPYHLRLNISALWATDTPRAVLFMFRLELVEEVLVSRQADAFKCPGSVWSITSFRTPATDAPAEEVALCIQTQIDKFCTDYLQAKEHEKEIQSRLPTMPEDFFSEPQ